jgi:hypothetical protein
MTITFLTSFIHGTQDLYCYSCDDARTDSLLQEHLAHFSIEIAKQEKTEKSMTELVRLTPFSFARYHWPKNVAMTFNLTLFLLYYHPPLQKKKKNFPDGNSFLIASGT